MLSVYLLYLLLDGNSTLHSMHTASKVYYVLTAYRSVRIFLNNRHINAEFNIWSILKIPQCSQTEVESCASKKNFLPTALLTAFLIAPFVNRES